MNDVYASLHPDRFSSIPRRTREEFKRNSAHFFASYLPPSFSSLSGNWRFVTFRPQLWFETNQFPDTRMFQRSLLVGYIKDDRRNSRNVVLGRKNFYGIFRYLSILWISRTEERIGKELFSKIRKRDVPSDAGNDTTVFSKKNLCHRCF